MMVPPKKKKNYLNFSIAGRGLISGEFRKRAFVLNLYFPGLFPNHDIHKLMQIFSHRACEAGSSSQSARLPKR